MSAIDHNHCLVRTAMHAFAHLPLRLTVCLGLSLAGLAAAQAQHKPLSAGALFDATRQVAVDQARQTEAGAAAQAGRSLHSPLHSPDVGAQTGLSALQAPRGHEAPFGTGYERRMERAAAMAGLAVGSPARPAAAGAAAGGGAGAGSGAHAGGQGSGRGRR